MKAYKVIAFCVAQFLRIWVSATVFVATYVPMSALAYAERGYKAIGGEIIPPIILTAVAWVGMGWLTETLYKEYVAEIRLIRAAKAMRRFSQGVDRWQRKEQKKKPSEDGKRKCTRQV